MLPAVKRLKRYCPFTYDIAPAMGTIYLSTSEIEKYHKIAPAAGITPE